MVVVRLWRVNSRLDGEYSRVIEDVNRGRFYELAYSEKREKEYLNESTPMWRHIAGEIAFVARYGTYKDYNPLTDAELVTILYEGE
ncbi:hypothetical protein [Escherichia coli]|uniref:hypothetical protein n=1 Tax=Escherichia coli TaxID=562 RepID=UPI001FF30551|nr:hypothetical protein [Escherichia coli]